MSQAFSLLGGAVSEGAIDLTRPAQIAHCLDRAASAVEKISAIAQEIDLRNSDQK